MKSRIPDIIGIHTITIQVSNFTKSLTFYRDILGIAFEKIDEEHGVAWTKFNEMNFIIHKQFDDLKNNRGGITIHLQVPNADKYYQYLSDQGLNLSEKPSNKPWNVREFKIIDPDGYNIEIVEPIM